MKATFRSLLLQAAGLLWAVWGLVACSTPARITYFQDLRPGESEQQVVAATEIKVRPGDKLSIIVNSRDPQLTQLFNLPYVTKQLGQGNLIASGNMEGYSQGVSGYTVDEQGMIDFPVLGKIELAGKNREEIAAFIKEELLAKNLVKDPVVTVEYMNLCISVLGEVASPGRYSIDRDKVTLLDAISMAGDLTIYGKREKVLVLREENGVQRVYGVNLCSAEHLYTSPVYYLRQNDVVYVEPNNVRARQATVNGNNVRSTSFWISLASLLTTIAVLVFK
ncbi:polysaccharide biosynthesis/export family protein [uncultured Phocaeicola sp.]|uniref:polysaccharide biosynthesis/export family protein n=1 Tax=uncultured Phocaeicola sp. TaxID=990718 RepID=UPI0025E2FB93|nr:polysaccharide biosynthesis/export family protein [uncultured Phocaeicola sp.]